MKCERCGYDNFEESHYCKKCWAELDKSNNDGHDDELSRYKNRSNYSPSYNAKKNLYDGNNKYLKGLYNTNTDNDSNLNRRYSATNGTQYNNTYANRRYSSIDNTQYNNSAYGTTEYSPTDNTQYDNSSYGTTEYSPTDNTQYDNSSYGTTEYSSADNTQYDNSGYSDNQYTTSESSSYNNQYNNRQYPKQESKQYDDNLNNDIPFSIYNARNNRQSYSQGFASQGSYNYNNQSTISNNQSVYNKYKKTPYYTDETRERANRRAKNIISFIGIIPVVLYALFYVIIDMDGGYTKRPEIAGNEPAIQATQPTVPVAELGYSLQTIATSEGGNFKAKYHPPKGYDFVDSIIESYANYECDIYGETVSLTTMFFNSDTQKEVDYYKNLEDREGTTVEINDYDTDLGKVTEIMVATDGKGINYQFFVEAKEGCTLYISMTNVPANYAEDAETICDLLVNDIEVSHTEEKTEAPTE